MNLSLPIFLVIWMAPMAALAAFDVRSIGKVHRVTAICCAVMVLAFPRLLLEQSESWRAIGRALLRPLL